MISFASDNYAPAHPEVLDAIERANEGSAPSYGADDWTARSTEHIRQRLKAPQAEPFLVFNGTGANVLCLSTLCRSWEAVICSDTAHLHTDEAGAPEIAGRTKLLPISAGPDGKLTPERCAPQVNHVGDEHSPQARVVSIAQSTELGTVYTEDEIAALADWAHANDLFLHVDGARFFNGGTDLPGVDAVSLGATKIGGLGAEAAVFIDPDLARYAKFHRKQLMQLGSKLRYLAVQFEALIETGLADRLATHANAMAQRLAEGVKDAVTISRATQANAVFAILDPARTTRLQEDFHFYVWDEHTGEVRWMTAWDTTEAQVDAFAAAVRAA